MSSWTGVKEGPRLGLGEDWNRDQAREDVDEHAFPLYDEKQKQKTDDKEGLK